MQNRFYKYKRVLKTGSETGSVLKITWKSVRFLKPVQGQFNLELCMFELGTEPIKTFRFGSAQMLFFYIYKKKFAHPCLRFPDSSISSIVLNLKLL